MAQTFVSLYDEDLAESFIVDGKILIRGTLEWDARERKRKKRGNRCISFGLPNLAHVDYVQLKKVRLK